MSQHKSLCCNANSPLIIFVALVFALTGCSGVDKQISEIEKRNRFDACVLDFMASSQNQSVSAWKFDRGAFRQAAEIDCRHLLR